MVGRTTEEGQHGIPAIPPELSNLDLEMRVVVGITLTAEVAQKKGKNLDAGCLLASNTLPTTV